MLILGVLGIVVLLVLVLIYLTFGKDLESFQMPSVYEFRLSNSKKKKIVIISGVHGNEPAGAIILNQLIKKGYFEQLALKCNSDIIVIPRVNEYGLRHNIRWQNNWWKPDINRNFNSEGGTEEVSDLIASLTRDANLVIDFHEGWGYHKLQPSSVGSTVSPSKTALNLGVKIIQEINQQISNPNKKFTLLTREECTIPTALSCYLKDIPYILIETTGQNNIQPLEIRTNQILTTLNAISNHFGKD